MHCQTQANAHCDQTAHPTALHSHLQHEGDRGQVVNLLRIAAEPSVDLGIRHIAAITFKNTVKRRWDPEEDGE